MGIFKLVEFEQNKHLTIVMDDEQAISIFGEIAASYVVLPITQNTCRLILKGLIRYPRNSFWSWMRYILPWGDLLMMRQQFFRLKTLAESQTNSSSEVTSPHKLPRPQRSGSRFSVALRRAALMSKQVLNLQAGLQQPQEQKYLATHSNQHHHTNHNDRT